MRIHGGCHCGRITYEADIDPEKVGVFYAAADRDPMNLGAVKRHAKQPM